MSSKGLVYLYDSDTNAPISVRKYSDRTNRKKIIDDWRKRYAAGFYRCYIVISPEISDDLDYDYIEKKLDGQEPEIKKLSFKRPKAEYKSIYNTDNHYKYDID